MAGICTPHHVGRDKPHPGLAARHMWNRRWIGENALSDWRMRFEGGVDGVWLGEKHPQMAERKSSGSEVFGGGEVFGVFGEMRS